MWILYAASSALFAGLVSVLAKYGIKNTDSTVATAIRTIVVLIFSWVMVFIVGSQSTMGEVSIRTWIFLALSGLATGASWLCYFKALQLGDINKVVPVDKSSIVLTIVLAFVFLGEPVGLKKFIGVALIGVGTFLMIQKRRGETIRTATASETSNRDTDTAASGVEKTFEHSKKIGWLVYALLSAVFASLTTILGKIGIDGVESNLGTAVRTAVVLLMAWFMVFAAKKQENLRKIDSKELLFICLSGFATGGSWLCYYKALQDGLASVVVPIDKLSILVTILFSYVIFKEKLMPKALIGLALIVVGTLLMI